ncbi:MAG: hypothetical protein LIO90_09170 [Bacteroidales bacterium]|nr:hypothetical protein [Bacteroidales bacterium]
MTPDNNTPSSTQIAGSWLAIFGLLLVGSGTLMPLLNFGIPYNKYIYCTGAVALLVGRIAAPYRGSSMRVKRLSRIEFWSAVIFCVAGFFMFYEPAGVRDWLAFTLAGAVLQVYSSLMIPRAESRDRQS